MAKLIAVIALLAACIAVASATAVVSTYGEDTCTTRIGMYQVRFSFFFKSHLDQPKKKLNIKLIFIRRTT